MHCACIPQVDRGVVTLEGIPSASATNADVYTPMPPGIMRRNSFLITKNACVLVHSLPVKPVSRKPDKKQQVTHIHLGV